MAHYEVLLPFKTVGSSDTTHAICIVREVNQHQLCCSIEALRGLHFLHLFLLNYMGQIKITRSHSTSIHLPVCLVPHFLLFFFFRTLASILASTSPFLEQLCQNGARAAHHTAVFHVVESCLDLDIYTYTHDCTCVNVYDVDVQDDLEVAACCLRRHTSADFKYQ